MKLVVRQGTLSGVEFALDKPVLIIGRGSEADIAIPDEKASRRHAEIRLAGNQLFVTDLGSTNGTLVNGARILGTHPLQPGDVISIGNTAMGVQEGLARASAPAAAAMLGMPIPPPSDLGQPPAAPQGRPMTGVWLGVGALAIIAALAIGAWLAWQAGWLGGRTDLAKNPTAPPQLTEPASTPTPQAIVVAPTTTPSPTPEASATMAPTATRRSTDTGGTPGTPGSRSAPYTVRWSSGGYEGWAEGRRMSSNLTIQNNSLPQLSPPYKPYFVISDANGAMRVGESRDYSSSSNPLPTLPPGGRVVWTWFTIMSNKEWVRGSVFRYGGWSWAQEFNPDGSLKGSPYAISDQNIIPFLPVQIPPEQLATVFPAP